ncbi:MAG TPA: efflux RND transporter periplasmic adaptor subunit [Dokdonella sp.]|nr:efflux RND transporter periplasmic adaptor subunit [Dokdonella sp.]HPG94002.1 efflux RND transporter periplasmic adaptor subunit [Dokdonella sp.]HPN78719.1 efflux RND transporter periplasmic adaptor subunit [Dokdonella sp.]
MRMQNKGELLNQLRIDRNRVETPSRMPWIVTLILVVLLAVGAAVWWWKSSRANFEVSPVAAIAPTANGSASSAVLQATGYVTARRQATVSAQITGTLSEVLIEEGEHVDAGQVLARLEDTAQRANLAQAQAQVAQARAQVGQFKARLDQSRRDLARQQDLVGRKLVSKQAVEVAQTETDSLSAQLTAQQRTVELASAQALSAQVQLDYTTVRAPFAGVVVAKAAQVGEIVSPLSAGGGFTRTGVGTIVDMDSLEIEVDVNESYINRVKPGAPAEAVLDAYQDWTVPARVIAIIPTADRGKATVKVRVGLDQKDPRILPDMGARVSFMEEKSAGPVAAEPPKGVLLPGSAIVQRDGKSVVFVIDGDRVAAKPVIPGQNMGDLRLVEGIAAATQVVREPPAEMQDGARIELKK